ncbi:MAG: hypothetical protein ABIP89_15745 [Polyangiaceae bacterium]
MTKFSTTAWVLHDLGLAAGFGGNLFGQLAMNPAVKVIESKRERGKVTHAAWDRYKIVNGVALAAMAGSWLIGRTFLTGKEVGRDARATTRIKDLLVGGATVAGVGALITGTMLDRASGGAPVIESGSEPAAETPSRVARLQAMVNAFGAARVLLEAGIVATTAILAMQSGRSARWSFISRLLP